MFNPGFKTVFRAFLAFVLALIAVRIFYTGTREYLFLAWNLFLAWIPFAVSYYFSAYAHKAFWKQAVLFGTWLLFFPNALYIVTDLVHLQDARSAPWWYDAIILFSSSLIGLIMGFVSLRRAELYLAQKLSRRMVSLLLAFGFFIGSYGVYLGRFERWNSWDVFVQPFPVAIDIARTILKPTENYKVWMITCLLTLSYAGLYYLLRILPQAFAEIKNGPGTDLRQ